MTSRSEVDSILNMQMQQAVSAPFPKGAIQMFIGEPPKKDLWLKCNGDKFKVAAFPELAKKLVDPVAEGEEPPETFSVPQIEDDAKVEYWVFSGEPLIEDSFVEAAAPAAGA